jgi:Rps23 Pro-64 3,4-dihydroxylase Tpa1-like proline 4-hydroxylase
MLNNDYKIDKITYPYEIYVIDNLMDEKNLKRIKQSWLNIEDNMWHTGYKDVNGKKNILEQGMRAISEINKMPLFLQETLKYFHSDIFTDFISKTTNTDDLIPDETMRWSGLRVMEPNSYQLIHSDARQHPNNILTKELTCLFYLNENYDKESHEGCLEIWDDTMTKRTHEIEPLDNRMVIFVNSETSYHGVPKVLKDRRAITFSIMSTSKSSTRNKALFVARPTDSEEISNLGKKRAEIKDKK